MTYSGRKSPLVAPTHMTEVLVLLLSIILSAHLQTRQTITCSLPETFIVHVYTIADVLSIFIKIPLPYYYTPKWVVT